jgi:hypothetical protein
MFCLANHIMKLLCGLKGPRLRGVRLLPLGPMALSLRLINAIVIGFDPWCSHFTVGISLNAKYGFMSRHNMVFNELRFQSNINIIAVILSSTL